MPKKNENEVIIPDYASCKTKAAIETEYINWAYSMSVTWYCTDNPGVPEADAKKKIQELLNTGDYKKFHYDTDENGTRYYYTGGKSDRKKMIQNQHSAMNSAKRNLTAESAVTSITQGWEYTVTGTKVYTKDQQTEFQKISEAVKNGTLTGQAKIEAIKNLNTKYGTSLPENATYKDIANEGNKTKGGLVNEVNNTFENINTGWKSTQKEVGSWFVHETDPETGKKKPNKIEQTIQDLNKQTFGSASKYWDKSDNKYVQKFTKQGITGDIMWGVLTGKYNTDDKCRKDLKKLAEDINGKPPLTEAQRKERIRAINEKYKLNIDENATPEDLTAVINSQDSYSYKKKVKDIAGRIIYDKVNDNLNAQLEERFGKTLSKFGINFSFKDRDTIADIKAIIRGQKMIHWDKDKVLKALQDQLEKKIGVLIEEKVNQALDKQTAALQERMDSWAEGINQKLVDNSIYRSVESWNTQLDAWTSNPDTLKLEIADRLDAAIANPVNGIANTLDNLDPLKKLGLGSLGLGKMFTDITGAYTKGFAEKINAIVQPVLKKALTVTTKIKAAVKKLQDKVTELKNKAKELVEKWKNTVKDMVAKQTKALVNKLVNYVKVEVFSGLSSSFKI